MRNLHAVFLIAAVTFIFLAACHHEKSPVTSDITGSVTHHTDCIPFQADNLKFTEPDTFSCVQYSYDPANFILSLQHFNAGFSCCPEEIYCEIFTSNDTIIIQEFEKEPGCYCLCLFDLDIEVNNVDQNKYVLKFVEPYAEGQEELIFGIDLTLGINGEYCVIRQGYPWGY